MANFVNSQFSALFARSLAHPFLLSRFQPSGLIENHSLASAGRTSLRKCLKVIWEAVDPSNALLPTSVYPESPPSSLRFTLRPARFTPPVPGNRCFMAISQNCFPKNMGNQFQTRADTQTASTCFVFVHLLVEVAVWLRLR